LVLTMFASDELPQNHHAVVVIGAGLAGIASAVRLRQAGIEDFVVLERADRVGGTWRDAVYPGAEVDVPSWLYSLSFAPKTDWSKMNSPAPEILTYIKDVVERFGLAPHLRFGAEVVRAEFDETAGGWQVTTADGRSFGARAVIAADGLLSNAEFPSIAGLETFGGQLILSARWPQGCDMSGKRVAVIGTGATAVQIVPELVNQAEHVTVFQRTPAWALPRSDFHLPEMLKWLFGRYPAIQRGLRAVLFLVYEFLVLGSTRVTPLTSVFEAVSRHHLRSQVKDPELLEQLTPSHRIGCKRPVITSTFYPALQRANCTLVPHGVVEVTASGLRAADGSDHEVDCIVFATGYDVSRRGAAFAVVGRGGRILGEEWARGMVGYKSVSVAGYPNLFWIMGPNSLGHSSILLFIEEQVAYSVRGVREILDKNLRELDVRLEAQAAHNAQLQRRLEKSTFGSGCQSWYLTEDGYNGTVFPGTVTAYRRQMATLDLRDYVSVVAAPERTAVLS
jgi:cation diffusion facilitator CzcD-associated flavoprotein CzcO